MTAVGIDVGKRSLDVAMDGHTKVIRFPNTQAGITKLISHLASVDDPRIAVEATGGYEQPLLDAVCDARLLALMARLFADRLRRYVPVPPWQRELRDWLCRRGQLVTAIQAHKQQAAMAPQWCANWRPAPLRPSSANSPPWMRLSAS